MRGRRKVKTIIRVHATRQRKIAMLFQPCPAESTQGFLSLPFQHVAFRAPVLIVSLDTYNLGLTQPLVDRNLWERQVIVRGRLLVTAEGPGRSKAYLQARNGSQRHFSLVKVLVWAQSEPRSSFHPANRSYNVGLKRADCIARSTRHLRGPKGDRRNERKRNQHKRLYGVYFG